MTYDSRPDTLKHIGRVQELLNEAIENLDGRANVHDQSKLEEPEKPLFDEFTPKLRALTYGSEEYKAVLTAMGPALQHHYANNDHHPEFSSRGIAGMSLLSQIEMLCDWKAASERHADGDFAKSLEINRKRFGIDDQTYAVFFNTARELGWVAALAAVGEEP